MTERKENVEPPLASRPTQITLLLLASLALISLSLIAWRDSPSPAPQHHLADRQAGLNASAVLCIDLNVAEPRELALLPGVGSILANRIAASRNRLGRFASVDELTRVHGIGPKKLSQIREICVVGAEPPDRQREESMALLRDPDDRERTGSFDPACPSATMRQE